MFFKDNFFFAQNLVIGKCVLVPNKLQLLISRRKVLDWWRKQPSADELTTCNFLTLYDLLRLDSNLG